MLQRIKHMLIKEFIQVLRDPRMMGVIFVAPVLQLLLFGYAVNTDVRDVPMAVADGDRTPASREFVAAFIGSGYFHAVAAPGNPAEIQAVMDRGTVRCVLQLKAGFAQDLDAGHAVAVQLLLDGTDSNTAMLVANYAAQITAGYSEKRARAWLTRQGAGARREPSGVRLEPRAWFNQNLESRNYYVPGVVATIVTLVTLMLTSMAIVREKEIGTMEQIMVTPIRPWEFVLGKMAPFVAIGYIDVVLVTTTAVFWFGVPIRGSLLLLFLGTGVFIITTLGGGLLISTVCGTMQQAMMTAFFFFLPGVLLSGFMFPIANMPPLIQWLTLLNPLRYYLVIIRGIFLKGVGLEVLGPQFLALAALGVAVFIAASLRFHKTAA